MVSANSRCGKLIWMVLAVSLALSPLLTALLASAPGWLLLLQGLLSVLAFCICLRLAGSSQRKSLPAAKPEPDRTASQPAAWLGQILPLWHENLSLAVLHNERSGKQLAQHLLLIHGLLHSIQSKGVDEPVNRLGIHLARLAESAAQLDVLCSRGLGVMTEDQRQAWLGELQSLGCSLQQDARHARQSLLPLQAPISHPPQGWPQPFFNTLQQASAALQQALVELQSEDRVSQIINQVVHDQQMLQNYLCEQPQGMGADELENWLSRFRASYTTDEQRALAKGSVQDEPGRRDDGITYF